MHEVLEGVSDTQLKQYQVSDIPRMHEVLEGVSDTQLKQYQVGQQGQGGSRVMGTV